MIVGWRDAPSKNAYRMVFAKLFRALKKARPETIVTNVAQDAFDQAMVAFRARAHQVFFLKHLRESTFLTPVESIVLSIDQVVRRDVDSIAKTISASISNVD